MADKLLYAVQDYRKKRVIIDTDAACEANDPFAIAHALMSRMLDVRAVCAEHENEEPSEAVRFIIQEAERESDNPLYVLCIGATTNVDKALIIRPQIAQKMTIVTIGGSSVRCVAPWVNEDTSYTYTEEGPKIKVYTSINSRFIIEDFICKLQILYSV